MIPTATLEDARERAPFFAGDDAAADDAAADAEARAPEAAVGVEAGTAAEDDDALSATERSWGTIRGEVVSPRLMEPSELMMLGLAAMTVRVYL